MTLADFLLARIAEDETAAKASPPDPYGGDNYSVRFDSYESDHSDEDRAFVARFNPTRVLVECEAKRRIVEDYEALDADYRMTRAPETESRRFQALVSIGQLATAYADHPDYRQEWRP